MVAGLRSQAVRSSLVDIPNPSSLGLLVGRNQFDFLKGETREAFETLDYLVGMCHESGLSPGAKPHRAVFQSRR